MARPVGAKATVCVAPQPTAISQNGVKVTARPPNGVKIKKAAPEDKDYTSDGVTDNDVFLLPISDYQILIGITFVAAIIRLFRIYQPNSVVFDEVQ